MTPPTLLFFLKIALAIQGLLWLHINFKIIYCSYEKNDIAFWWAFNCIESVDFFG